MSIIRYTQKNLSTTYGKNPIMRIYMSIIRYTQKNLSTTYDCKSAGT